MQYINGSSLVAHFAKRNTKNCGGEKRSGESEGEQKFLPRPPERKSFCFCRAKRGNQNSQSGFCSKKVRISSSKHHHIELAASLGASPLASAGKFARKSKGFLKSIESFCWLIWRFANLKSLPVLKNRNRFFSFVFGERQSEILLNCRCKALPFSK